MNALAHRTVDSLCNDYFQYGFSPSNLEILRNIDKHGESALDFTEHIFRLMQRSRFDARDCTASLAWVMGVMMPSFIPSAWGGVIPPFTEKNRHQLIDRYLARNTLKPLSEIKVLLDIGCGYPPNTALDAARQFPNARVIGSDPSFPDFIVYDDAGNYACLDRNGTVVYFQPRETAAAAMIGMYQNPHGTIAYFEQRFAELLGLVGASHEHGKYHEFEHEGWRLVRNPILGRHAANLELRKAGIGDAFEPCDAIRCMNVLYYYGSDFRRNAESWAAATLGEGGIFLCGADSALTLEAQYTVYQNTRKGLLAKEFAISIGNVRPLSISPWFTMSPSDKESASSAFLVGLLREDKDFCTAHDQRLDQLLAEARLWERHPDGHLVAPSNQRSPSEWLAAREAIYAQMEHEGLVDHAVSALARAGFRAWKNSVGHIAVDPTDLTHEA